MISVTHDTARSRYTATVDGVLCVLDYQLQGNTMAITHTGVPSQVGGRGIAAALTRHALDDARGAILPGQAILLDRLAERIGAGPPET